MLSWEEERLLQRGSELQKVEKMQVSAWPGGEVQSDFILLALDDKDLADKLPAKRAKTEKCRNLCWKQIFHHITVLAKPSQEKEYSSVSSVYADFVNT